MRRRGRRRRSRIVGLSGLKGQQRARLETRVVGIVVGTILVEVGKTTAVVYQAMYQTPSLYRFR